jgi:Immunity protein 21
MQDTMTWVGTGGGPLIAICAEIAPHWRGGDGVRITQQILDRWWERLDLAGSDYGRACAINDSIGTLEVGPRRALILNDEPMQTAFVPRAEGGVFVRWMYAENEDEVRRAVQSIPESIWEATPHSIEVARAGVLLFDSAYPGDDLPISLGDGGTVPWLRLELPSGTYHVESADYSSDDSTRLILHLLKKHRDEPTDPRERHENE